MTSLQEKVGEIQNCREQSIQWNIKQYFTSISQKADSCVTSPYFHFASTSWYLKLYPNGERVDDTVGNVNLFLCSVNPRTGHKVNFTLGIKRSDGSLIEKPAEYLFLKSHEGFGYTSFVNRDSLRQNRDNLVPGGTLTVICRARCESSVKEVGSQTINFDDVSLTLSEDLKNLFINEKNSDVTIKVKDKKFRVHKLVLECRSSVLSAMFEHDMKENTTGIVDIDDCEPEIFHDFLLYLYSGKVEKLSSNNVVGLHFLADKYDLGDLRQICLDFMKENLDLSNVCGVMEIADRHNEEELKKSASQMIKSNLKTLVPSSQWITFMVENPVLAAELLMEVLPDSKS